MSGFESHYLRMAELATRVPEAGKAAVSAGLAPIYEKANERVPVAPVDGGALKASGKIIPPEVDGMVISGAVNYGSDETMTPWHGGTGYEIFVNFGTDHTTYYIKANPFLTSATLESIDEIPALEATAFQEAMAGA